MGISDILSEDMVLAGVEAGNKRGLLEQLSAFVAEKENIDKNSIFEAILERENLGSTGYGDGIAFPHARIEGLDKVIAVFARLDKGIDYDSLDSHPVDLIAFLLSPEKSGEDHLQALAVMSRVLKDAETCRKIREAKSAHEIYLALQK
ncbi:MAG: PTS sugar transporter subunit IIA [Alphaproteobacteria bacterium]|nr:PTS sugar transporter subunit IIA [Alphaproteobacteria bacterium]